MKSLLTARRSALQLCFALLLLFASIAVYRAAANGTGGAHPALAVKGHTGQALLLRAALNPAGVPPLTKMLLNAHTPAAKARSVMQMGPAAATSGPPLLDPYTAGLTGEVIHVTDANGNIVRNGQVAPGGVVNFTVRLTPQTNPIDDNNVYIQIKDPDSKYQDAQSLEHKVFTQDATDSTNRNGLNPSPSNGDSGSATSFLYNGGNGNTPGYFTVGGNLAGFPQRGAVGGYDTATSQPITVGRTGGGTNPVMTGTPPAPLPGDDPRLFTSYGQEYECQYVNAQFARTGSTTDTGAEDYGTPFYLAGVDDQALGSAPTARPEWLKLRPANPDANGANQPDADGSYRYTASWTTPVSPSDYYLDVIAYDTVRNWRIYDNVWGFSTLTWNSNPTLYPDFSNANDILVVADNALGQKFVAATNFQNLQPTFYGAESYYTDYDISRLPDAAYTLVQDVSGAAPDPEVIPFTFSQDITHVLNGLGVGSYVGADPISPRNPDLDPVVDRTNNTAIDPNATSDTTTIAGHLVPRSQKYVIWRTLSRGALDPDVLNAYSGSLITQGGVTTPVATRCVIWVAPYANSIPLNSQGSIEDQRTQDLLHAYVLGGTIGTTTFPGLGRLFLSGPAIATVLNQEGANSFLTDVLNTNFVRTHVSGAQLSDVVGTTDKTQRPMDSPNRITHDAFVNFFNPGNGFGAVTMNFYTNLDANGFHYQQPSVVPFIPGNDYIKESLGARFNEPPYRTDGSLADLGPFNSTFGPNQNSILGLFDAVYDGASHRDANGNYTTDQKEGTGEGLLHKALQLVTTETNPNDPLYPNLVYYERASGGSGYGSRTVFSSFGLDEIGIEYNRVPLTFGSTTVVNFVNLNQRPNVLHNIVCYLRTATFTGLIKAGNSALGVSVGQPIAGATVTISLQQPDPNNPVAIPGPIQSYTTTTDVNGRYTLRGVEPGAYQVLASKPGFESTISNSGLQGSSLPFTVEGDTSTADVNLNLNVKPIGRLVGTVTDKTTGLPIPNAALTFTSTDGFYTATGTTGADGTYNIDGVIADTYTGIASASGYVTSDPSAVVTVPSGAAAPPVNFQLVPIPGSLGGLVKDSFTGLAVPGAKISVTSTVAGAVSTTLTTTTGSTPAAGPNGDGNLLNYVLSGLSPGTYTVTITPPQYYTVSGSATRTVTVLANTFTRVPDFSLNSSLGQLGGLVKNATTGQPFVGATVTAKDGNGNTFTFTTSGTVTSPAAPTGDNQPLNYIGSLPPGRYTVTISATNYRSQTFNNVNIATHVFTRQDANGDGGNGLVSNLGTLGGLIRDAYPTDTTGAAITGASVVVTDSSNNTVYSTTTTGPTASPNDGGITGDGGNVNYDTGVTLLEGSYTVTASATNFVTTQKQVTVTHGQFTRGDVALHSTQGTVGGLVTDARTGQPLGGATVTITTVPDSSGNSTTMFGPFTTDSSGNTTTPASGRYGDGSPVNFVTTLTAGTYQLVIAKQGNGSTTKPDFVTQTSTITVTADKFLRVNAALVYAYATIGGLIEDSFSNQLLSGATVTITDSSKTVVTTVTSSSNTTSPSAPNGDGQPLNYTTGTVVYAGTGATYTVSVAASDHTVATQSATVAAGRFKRVDFTGTTNGLQSTLGYIGGLVLDSSTGAAIGAATVTITDTSTPPNVVTTFTTSATTSTASAPTGDGSAVNYSGPLHVGSYNASVTRRGYGTTVTLPVSITANHFTRIDFSGSTNGLPPIHVFGAGYNFFSVPYDYSSIGIGFDDLFGTLNTGTRTAPSAGSNRSHIFVWNPQLVQYVLDPTAPADGLHLGQGYWVYLLNAHEVTVAGNTPTASSVTVSLHQGWNQIGVPSLSAVSVSNMTFNNAATGATINFANASGSVYRLVSGTLYGYNGSSYYTVTSGGSLQPWQSYWIYAFTDVTVNIPTR